MAGTLSSTTGPRGPESSWGTSGGTSGGSLSGSQLSNFSGGGSSLGSTGPRGPESSWGTSGGASGGSLSGGQLSNWSGGGSGGNTGGSGTGPRGPESSWGTSGGVSGGALSGSQLSNWGTGGGNIGGALNAGLGGSYAPTVPGGLRGVTGYYGELRTQPTPYGTNYNTAQMLRAAYPEHFGRFSQDRVTNTLNTFSKAMPGEADVMQRGITSMNNIGRVGLNQIVAYGSPEKMLGWMDTTGLDKNRNTAQFAVPGPNSLGMTDNWANPVQGAAYQHLAAQALQNAMLGRNISPQAMNATNFVAANTPLPNKVSAVGSPVMGTQFGIDKPFETRLERANTAALAQLNSPNNTQTASGPLSDPASTGALSTAGLEETRAAAQQDLAGLNTSQPTNIPTPIDRQPVLAGMGVTPAVPAAPAPVLSKQYYDRIEPTVLKDQERLLPEGTPTQGPVYTPGSGPVLSNADVAPPLSRTPTAPTQQTPQYRTYSEPVGPFIMSPGKSTAIKTGINTAAGFAPIVGPINALAGLFDRSLGDLAVADQNRIMNMTGPERAAYDAQRAQMVASGVSSPGGMGGNDRNQTSGGNPRSNTKGGNTAGSESNTGWQADAVAYGYSPEQLKDPEIAALIKQLWDMGFIPKTSSA